MRNGPHSSFLTAAESAEMEKAPEGKKFVENVGEKPG
jgi:hypothetical protein